MIEKLLIWLFFCCILPLVHMPMLCLIRWLKGIELGILKMLCDGRLCFYSATICAITSRDVFMAGTNNYEIIIKLLILGTIFIVSLFPYIIVILKIKVIKKRMARFSICITLLAVIFTIIIRYEMDLL